MNTHKILLSLLCASTLAALTGCPSNNDNNAENNDNNTNNIQTDATPDQKVDGAPDTQTDDTTGGGECVDVTVYEDKDADGKGDDDVSKQVCLKADEQEAGFVRESGDCDDADALVFDGADGICGDNVDDNCDNSDEACPTTMPAGDEVLNWDCTGDAPASVLAVARLGDNSIYESNSCFAFVELSKGAFYATRIGFEKKPDAPSTQCSSFDSSDGLLYAFTKSDAEPCEEIILQNGPDENGMRKPSPVSNSCRKLLYSFDTRRTDTPVFIGSSIEGVKARLDKFSTVEIACVGDTTSPSFTFKSLENLDNIPVEYLDSYVAK